MENSLAMFDYQFVVRVSRSEFFVGPHGQTQQADDLTLAVAPEFSLCFRSRCKYLFSVFALLPHLLPVSDWANDNKVNVETCVNKFFFVSAVVVSLYQDPIQPQQAASVVEKLGDYLITCGY